MSEVAFERDGAALRGVDVGAGLPLLYGHGLGGAEPQVSETVPAVAGVRRLTLECRGHGGSAPGPRRPFSIALFADDALAFLDGRGVDGFVAGGISMGAAVALRLAVRQGHRVRGLVLARPAWLFDAAPPTLRPYAEVAAALRSARPAEARARFGASATARHLARHAPDNLASLLGFFDAPDPATLAELLGDIAADGPGVSRAEAAALRLPTLVIGQEEDEVHPLATAREIAATIPGAILACVAPKGRDRAAHAAGCRAAVADFLRRFPT